MDKTQHITTAFYDRHAEAWAGFHTDSFFHEAGFRRFHRYLKAGARILDIGCGHGIHVPLFLGMGRHLGYAGLDASRALLAVAKRRYPQLAFHHANILDARALPRKRYDGFWASAVLMHIPEVQWPTMLKNIEAIMRTGAIGYLVLPRKRPSPPSRRDRRFFSFWTPKKLCRVVEPRGWKILARGEMPNRAAGWMWFLARLPKGKT